MLRLAVQRERRTADRRCRASAPWSLSCRLLTTDYRFLINIPSARNALYIKRKRRGGVCAHRACLGTDNCPPGTACGVPPLFLVTCHVSPITYRLSRVTYHKNASLAFFRLLLSPISAKMPLPTWMKHLWRSCSETVDVRPEAV